MSFDMPPDEPPDELSYTKYELEQMTAERDRLQAEVERLREAAKECLKAVDDAYEVTGWIRLAKDSVQRRKIEAALAQSQKGTP